MQSAKRIHEGEDVHLLIDPPQAGESDPEFSSEPMPAAFSACLFLGVGLLFGLVVALFWFE